MLIISFYLEKREIFLCGDHFFALGDPIVHEDGMYSFPAIRGNKIRMQPLTFNNVAAHNPRVQKVKFLLVKQ